MPRSIVTTYGRAISSSSSTPSITSNAGNFTFSPATPSSLNDNTNISFKTVNSVGTSTYGGQSEPLLRQSVEGSGFTVALRVNDNGVTAPYALRGFQMEYQTGARR